MRSNDGLAGVKGYGRSQISPFIACNKSACIAPLCGSHRSKDGLDGAKARVSLPASATVSETNRWSPDGGGGPWGLLDDGRSDE